MAVVHEWDAAAFAEAVKSGVVRSVPDDDERAGKSGGRVQ